MAWPAWLTRPRLPGQAWSSRSKLETLALSSRMEEMDLKNRRLTSPDTEEEDWVQLYDYLYPEANS